MFYEIDSEAQIGNAVKRLSDFTDTAQKLQKRTGLVENAPPPLNNCIWTHQARGKVIQLEFRKTQFPQKDAVKNRLKLKSSTSRSRTNGTGKADYFCTMMIMATEDLSRLRYP